MLCCSSVEPLVMLPAFRASSTGPLLAFSFNYCYMLVRPMSLRTSCGADSFSLLDNPLTSIILLGVTPDLVFLCCSSRCKLRIEKICRWPLSRSTFSCPFTSRQVGSLMVWFCLVPSCLEYDILLYYLWSCFMSFPCCCLFLFSLIYRFTSTIGIRFML